MQISAIIFGGIGALVETSELQRLAFNDAFTSAHIDYQWAEASYRDSLNDSGGAKRLATIKLSDGSRLSTDKIDEIHRRKGEYFTSRLANAKLPLRAGIAELLKQAQSQGIVLAWATTTSRANIEAVIKATGGALREDMFAFLGNDTLVTHQKPDPEIYISCLKAINLTSSQVLAIEDSPTGVVSAKAANIRTVAFPGNYHLDENFSMADQVVHNVETVLAT